MAKNEQKEKKSKSKGIHVGATVPEEQYKAIEKLDGVLGVGIKGVVGNIIHSWLHQQEWFSDIIRDRVKGNGSKKN